MVPNNPGSGYDVTARSAGPRDGAGGAGPRRRGVQPPGRQRRGRAATAGERAGQRGAAHADGARGRRRRAHGPVAGGRRRHHADRQADRGRRGGRRAGGLAATGASTSSMAAWRADRRGSPSRAGPAPAGRTTSRRTCSRRPSVSIRAGSTTRVRRRRRPARRAAGGPGRVRRVQPDRVPRPDRGRAAARAGGDLRAAGAGRGRPTLREAGVDLEFANWRGLVAPPGLAEADRRALTRLVDALHGSPEWAQVLARMNVTDAYLTATRSGSSCGRRTSGSRACCSGSASQDGDPPLRVPTAVVALDDRRLGVRVVVATTAYTRNPRSLPWTPVAGDHGDAPRRPTSAQRPRRGVRQA